MTRKMEERQTLWDDLSCFEDYISTRYPSSFYKRPHHHMGGFQHGGSGSFGSSWIHPTSTPTPVDIIFPVPDHGPPPPPPLDTASWVRSYTTEPVVFLNLNEGTRRTVPLGFEPPPSPPFSGFMRDSDPFMNGSGQDWEEMSVEEEDSDGVEEESATEEMDDAETETMMDGQPGKSFDDLDESEGDDADLPLQETVRRLREEVVELKMKMRRERLECRRLGDAVEEMMEYLRREKHMHWEHRPRQGASCHHFGERASEGGRRHTSQARRPGTDETQSKSIEDYNTAWKTVFDNKDASRTHISIPWPTSSLQVSLLSQQPPAGHGFPPPSRLPKEIRDDIFQLRKWNAFSFFVQAFGLYPRYMHVNSARSEIEASEEPREAIVFDIRVQGASRERLNALKSQLMQEKLRWHPDRLKRLAVGFMGEEEEAAKAVLSAVLDSSKACNRCLGLIT